MSESQPAPDSEATALIEAMRNELLGADVYVPSDTWKRAIRDVIVRAERWLGVE